MFEQVVFLWLHIPCVKWLSGWSSIRDNWTSLSSTHTHMVSRKEKEKKGKGEEKKTIVTRTFELEAWQQKACFLLFDIWFTNFLQPKLVSMID